MANEGKKVVLDGKAEFRKSGCTTMLHFLTRISTPPSSPLNKVFVSHELLLENAEGEQLAFGQLREVKEEEESREAGSFLRFLAALPSYSLSLRLDMTSLSSEDLSESEVSALLRAIASPSTRTLQTLQIWGPYDLPSSTELLSTSLSEMLVTNKSLHELRLAGLFLPGATVRSLFDSLHKNAHLTTLSLSGCRGKNWPSASDVLDSLRVNTSLLRIVLRRTPLEGQREAAIGALLERNAKNAEQLKALQQQNAKRVQPTTARLFLCGFPYSGKTTLASSLRKCSKTALSISPSPIKHFLSCSTSSNTMQQRTRGIEVSMIKNKKVKVSLWDLAGQDQYHAFHDNMFPNLSDEAIPSLFLFVWNPIQLDEARGNEIKDRDGQIEIKEIGMFRQEFKYWLKFIASKTLTSSKFRPRVLVVITRADRLLRRRVRLQTGLKNWLKNTFDQLREEFEEYIQFDWKGYFEMDARNHNQVKMLANGIFQCVENFLDSAPLVYPACDKARRFINECVYKKHSIDPVITKEEFLLILEKSLQLPSKEVLEAIALSLNDSGDLIYFKSSSLVVLDTQWFCYHIMGDLLYFHGSQFQASENGFFFIGGARRIA